LEGLSIKKKTPGPLKWEKFSLSPVPVGKEKLHVKDRGATLKEKREQMKKRAHQDYETGKWSQKNSKDKFYQNVRKLENTDARSRPCITTASNFLPSKRCEDQSRAERVTSKKKKRREERKREKGVLNVKTPPANVRSRSGKRKDSGGPGGTKKVLT